MADKYVQETSEEFFFRLFGIVSGGFTSLSIALGLKTGLFDVLIDRKGEPMTSQELADAAGLKERYVREWLGAMTTAHIIDLDKTASSSEKYHLPAHRLDNFRGASTLSGILATYIMGIPACSAMFPHMVEAFKKDGPRGHERSTTEHFHEFENGITLSFYNHCLTQEFIPSYPEIQAKLESGIQMLDVGSGLGHATRNLAKKFPESQFVGLDIAQSNVEAATQDAVRLGLKNVTYIEADASSMPDDWTSTFDYVFFLNVLHDTPRPDLIINEVKRVMKKDAFLSIIEFDMSSKIAGNVDNSLAPALYTVSMFYCLPTSYQYPDSHGLGTVWGREKIKEFLEGKGFALKSITPTPKMSELHFLCQKE